MGISNNVVIFDILLYFHKYYYLQNKGEKHHYMELNIINEHKLSKLFDPPFDKQQNFMSSERKLRENIDLFLMYLFGSYVTNHLVLERSVYVLNLI